MELITGDVEAFHYGFADLDALLVAARVERAFELQAGLGGRASDQFADGKAIRKRPAAPVLRDVAEQPVLDLVPFRCAGRIVVDAASFCSSSFQRRTRAPLEPPQSAVTVNSRASG